MHANTYLQFIKPHVVFSMDLSGIQRNVQTHDTGTKNNAGTFMKLQVQMLPFQERIRRQNVPKLNHYINSKTKECLEKNQCCCSIRFNPCTVSMF